MSYVKYYEDDEKIREHRQNLQHGPDNLMAMSQQTVDK